MKSTAALAKDAVTAARQGTDEVLVNAMLQSAEQQDKAQRLVLYVVSGLLAASMVVNVVLVAWVLNRSLEVSAFGVDLSAGDAAESSR